MNISGSGVLNEKPGKRVSRRIEKSNELKAIQRSTITLNPYPSSTSETVFQSEPKAAKEGEKNQRLEEFCITNPIYSYTITKTIDSNLETNNSKASNNSKPPQKEVLNDLNALNTPSSPSTQTEGLSGLIHSQRKDQKQFTSEKERQKQFVSEKESERASHSTVELNEIPQNNAQFTKTNDLNALDPVEGCKYSNDTRHRWVVRNRKEMGLNGLRFVSTCRRCSGWLVTLISVSESPTGRLETRRQWEIIDKGAL